MNSKYIILLLGLGGVIYLINNSTSQAAVDKESERPFVDLTRKTNNKDTLDKFALDNLDTLEANLASKIWTKAQPYTNYVEKYSTEFNVPTTLIYAIINKESVFNPTSIRYEHTLKEKSFGLMQILVSTARWLGFKGDEFLLVRPDTNIHYGTKYISYQLNRYKGDVKKAIAAYNAGSVKYTTNGKYINQNYVSDVFRIYTLLNQVLRKA